VDVRVIVLLRKINVAAKSKEVNLVRKNAIKKRTVFPMLLLLLLMINLRRMAKQPNLTLPIVSILVWESGKIKRTLNH
jgi:hypothetical protein